MPLQRLFRAPHLLIDAQHALAMDQEGFARTLGCSRRTLIRWRSGEWGPTLEAWRDLVRLVHPADPVLARRIADEMEESLESMGIAAPSPAPALEPAPVAAPPAPAPPAPLHALADSVVCAAAEAVAMTPQALRPALVAAFERAAVLGLGVDALRAALEPKA
jgi:DNA-binding XRE family transcriptional regulator